MNHRAGALVALVALVVLAAGACGGGGSGGGGTVAGTPIKAATVRAIYGHLSTLPSTSQWESCPLVTTPHLTAVYAGVERSSPPLDLAHPLVQSNDQFVARGAVDVKNGPRGGLVSCVFTGGKDASGLTLEVATGADASGAIAKAT